jgi:hypothetical protein
MGYNPASPAPGPRTKRTGGPTARLRIGTGGEAEALPVDPGVASVVLERPQLIERYRQHCDDGGDWAELLREREGGDHSAQESAA